MELSFPGESTEYRAARERLLQGERELRRATEAVAAARRALPPGGLPPEDYRFTAAEGPEAVRLSDLLPAAGDALAVYSMMFPRDPGDARPGPASGRTAALPLEEGPCPSCTALLDQLDGVVEHLPPHVRLVVLAKAPPARLADFARERGWRRLRLLSSAGTGFNRAYHAETELGHQRPILNVFRRHDDGVVRHFWASELLYAPTEPGQDPRHVGVLEPLWNLLDLTPAGRGSDWEEQLAYPCCA